VLMHHSQRGASCENWKSAFRQGKIIKWGTLGSTVINGLSGNAFSSGLHNYCTITRMLWEDVIAVSHDIHPQKG
jgi:molybdopterin biosynthesis enzyme